MNSGVILNINSKMSVKKILNFCGVFFSLMIITFSLGCFSLIVFPYTTQWLKYFLLASFYLPAFMAIWSLLTAYCINPGYIPKGYRYDTEKINKTDLALFQYVMLAREKQLIDYTSNTNNFEEFRQRSKTFIVDVPIDEDLYSSKHIAGLNQKKQSDLVLSMEFSQKQQQVFLFQIPVDNEGDEDDEEEAFEVGETESMDNDDYVGSFRYKYSIDSQGKKTLQSKLSIKGGESLKSRTLSNKRPSQHAQSPIKDHKQIQGILLQEDTELGRDIIQPLLGNSMKTAVNDSESSLFDFEKQPTLSLSENNFSERKLFNQSLSVNENITVADDSKTASRMGSINQSRHSLQNEDQMFQQPSQSPRKDRQYTLEQKISVNLTRDELEIISKKYLRICQICNCVKPPRSHHCSQCDRCCLRMDHHCPWVGNCVGLRNLKAFLLFTLYVQLMSFIYFMNFVVVVIRCFTSTDDSQCKINGSTLLLILSIVCCVLSVLFGIFTFAMFFDQVNMIRTSSSTIDNKQSQSKAATNTLRQKMPSIEHRTFNAKLAETLGSGGFLHLWWMVPVSGHKDVAYENELSQPYNNH